MAHAGKGVSGGSGPRKRRCVELQFCSADRKLLTLLLQGQNALLAEIGRLANSNEALVESLMEGEPEDEGGIPRTL